MKYINKRNEIQKLSANVDCRLRVSESKIGLLFEDFPIGKKCMIFLYF